MTCLPAEIKARRLERRLAVSVEEKRRVRLSAIVGLASPSSATKTAAPEQWNGEMIICLPHPEESGEFLRRLLSIRLSEVALAAEKESERMTPAIGSTDSIDPWHWKKKMS